MFEASVIEQPKSAWEEGDTIWDAHKPPGTDRSNQACLEEGGAFLVVHKSQ